MENYEPLEKIISECIKRTIETKTLNITEFIWKVEEGFKRWLS